MTSFRAVSFHDHFSRTAAGYAAFRPSYPPELFELLARLAPARDVAWDCATGSGQAAVGLAQHVERVIATDASASQIAAARTHERITYHVALAERSALPDAAAALITIAQALHWFDLDLFWDEARRVLRPRGIVAAWCYGLLSIEPAIDAALENFYWTTVGPHWPPERRMVETRYRDIVMPFEEVAVPPMWIDRELTLGELAGYLGTWSAVQRYRDQEGRDPIEPFTEKLRSIWGNPEERRRARWDLGLRVGRRTS